MDFRASTAKRGEQIPRAKASAGLSYDGAGPPDPAPCYRMEKEVLMPMNSEHVLTFLHRNNIQGEVLQLSQHVSTVEAAAQVLGVSPDCIVKSVVLLADSSPILVVTNGTTRIDVKRLANYLGIAKKRVKLADAPTVLEFTGFSVGSVPPFGHKTQLRTLIDSRVLIQAEVYAGGGEVEAVLRIAPAEIVRVTNAEIISLAEMD
jgi:Cys-tRNA(Pro) deacylase